MDDLLMNFVQKCPWHTPALVVARLYIEQYNSIIENISTMEELKPYAECIGTGFMLNNLLNNISLGDSLSTTQSTPETFFEDLIKYADAMKAFNLKLLEAFDEPDKWMNHLRNGTLLYAVYDEFVKTHPMYN